MNRPCNPLPIAPLARGEGHHEGSHPSLHHRGRTRHPRKANASGFTLLELLVVLMILVVVAGIMVALFGTTFRDSQAQGTLATMAQLREAIIGTPEQPGYQGDTAALPATLTDLFVQPPPLVSPAQPPPYVGVYDPNTRRGWRGPYIMNSTGNYVVNAARGFTTDYGQNGPTMLDAWGQPIVLQVPVSDPTCARLVSAGPDGIIQTPLATAMPTKAQCGDDIVMFLTHSDDRQ